MAVNRGSPPRPLFARVYHTLLGLVAIVVIIRFFVLDLSDPFKCKTLITGGRWQDLSSSSIPADTSTTSAAQPLPKLWQPKGCLLRKYKQPDVSNCLSGKRLVFAGDSTIRQVFWAVAQTLDGSVDPSRGDKHSDQVVTKDGAKIEFIWDPWLNGTTLRTELEYFSNDAAGPPPALLLAGSGLWYAKYAEKTAWPAAQWKAAIDSIVKHMPPKPAQPRSSMLLLAPVPVPAWDKLSAENKRMIQPEEVAVLNDYLQELSIMTPSTGIVWAFNEVMAGLPQATDEGGLHSVQSISNVKAQILLNLRCNAERAEMYPYDGTCCNTYAGPNYIQWTMLTIAFLLAWKAAGANGAPPTTSTSTSQTPSSTRFGLRMQNAYGKFKQALPRGTELNSIMVFLLVVVYCFYTDRTQIFNKVHKLYNPTEFFLLAFLFLLVAPLTIVTAPTDQPFLGRDQTDEWKGWMQILILIYHYTGASKVTWIYDIIRLMVASYLFMTGFGHTVYFYTKDDYSLKRVASVLLRLNLLSLVLPYMMRTDYLFYYFAPLVTVWFVAVYVTMKVGRKYNSNLKFMMGKIAVAALVMKGVVSERFGLLEWIFWALEKVARVTWDVKEWRFRVELDLYVVWVGMACAILYVNYTKSTTTTNNNPSTLTRLFYKLRKPAVVASWVFLPAYIYFQTATTPRVFFVDKFAYNRAHPYISPLAILAFVVVRNSTRRARNAYVKGWAWVGKCSLETFTLQFHVWLAGDTKGLLRVGVLGEGWAGRGLEFVVLTVVFLGVSWEMAAAMAGVVGWVMGGAGAGAGAGDAGGGKGGPQKGPRRPRLPVLPGAKKDAAGDIEMGGVGGAGRKDGDAPGGGGGASAVPVQAGPQPNLKARLAVLFGVLWFLNLTWS